MSQTFPSHKNATFLTTQRIFLLPQKWRKPP